MLPIKKYPGLISRTYSKTKKGQMRHLNLDAQKYEILYNNMLNAGIGYDKAQVRLAGKILDRIESFGVLQEDGSYKLKEDGPLTISFEDAEYKLLNEVTDGIRWNPRYVRESIAYLDWLGSASLVLLS